MTPPQAHGGVGGHPPQAGPTGQRPSFLAECWRLAAPKPAALHRVSAPADAPIAPVVPPPAVAAPEQHREAGGNKTHTEQGVPAALPRETGGGQSTPHTHPGVPEDVQMWGEDAVEHYVERLGIAEDMGIPIPPGGPAEQVARREALRVACGWPVATWPPGRDASRSGDALAHDPGAVVWEEATP